MAVLMLWITVVFAQNEGQSIGIGGGFNYSTLGGKNTSKIDPRLGINIGLIGQVEMLDIFVVQPELKFTTKGHSDFYYGVEPLDNDLVYMIMLYYVEVPILLKLNMGSDSFKLQPFIGPSFAYLIKAEEFDTEVEGNIENLWIHADTASNITEYLEPFDIGANIGIDAIFMKSIMLGLRYNYSFSKTYKHTDDYRNKSLMLNMALLFGF